MIELWQYPVSLLVVGGLLLLMWWGLLIGIAASWGVLWLTGQFIRWGGNLGRAPQHRL
jgi:hypothetical protein